MRNRLIVQSDSHDDLKAASGLCSIAAELKSYSRDQRKFINAPTELNWP